MAPVDPSVLLDLVATGALVVAGGVVYHGHIQTGVAGRMVLIGRVAGCRTRRVKSRWNLRL
jgi:hypothetical protein